MCLLQMLFLVPTSLVMHNFWELEHGSPAHQIEFINFMKVRRVGPGLATESSSSSRGWVAGWLACCLNWIMRDGWPSQGGAVR